MDFYQRLELVGKQIPKGFVTTYGQLALLCGKPGNARQVGYALREGRAGKEQAESRRLKGAREGQWDGGQVWWQCPQGGGHGVSRAWEGAGVQACGLRGCWRV